MKGLGGGGGVGLTYMRIYRVGQRGGLMCVCVCVCGYNHLLGLDVGISVGAGENGTGGMPVFYLYYARMDVVFCGMLLCLRDRWCGLL